MSKIGKSIDRESRSGLPWWLSGEESACPCRGHGFGPWPGEIPHATGQLSLCAMTPEPRPQGACSAQEKPPQWEAWVPQLERSTHSLQLEKAHAQQQLKPIRLPGVRHDWSNLAHTHAMILGFRQASSEVVKSLNDRISSWNICSLQRYFGKPPLSSRSLKDTVWTKYLKLTLPIVGQTDTPTSWWDCATISFM